MKLADRAKELTQRHCPSGRPDSPAFYRGVETGIREGLRIALEIYLDDSTVIFDGIIRDILDSGEVKE